jgi:hypothetical protein
MQDEEISARMADFEFADRCVTTPPRGPVTAIGKPPQRGRQ